MKTYQPDGTDNRLLFACEPAGMDTRKDFWSPKCGWGCGQGQDSKHNRFVTELNFRISFRIFERLE